MHTYVQTLAVNPAEAHLPVTLEVGFQENVSLSSPFDPQNVLSLPLAGQPCQHSVSLTLILSCFSKCKHVPQLLKLKSDFLQLSASKKGISKSSSMFMYECNQLVPRSQVSRGHNQWGRNTSCYKNKYFKSSGIGALVQTQTGLFTSWYRCFVEIPRERHVAKTKPREPL